MIQLATYQQLDVVCRDIAYMEANSPALSLFLGSKIRDFKQKNALHITRLSNKRNELAKKHCLLDAEEKPMTEMKDGINVYKFINDEHKQLFSNEMLEFMSLSFQMHA